MDKRKKSRKSNAPKINDLDEKQRKLAIIKQKQCDTIALHIVSKLIDCPVEEDVFLQSLKYLNQCHYQDIVEERVISKLCGYPICANEIKDIPTKKFHISTKTNKIYDITERKNYCSNFCYKAGIYIKEQMLTSPLWYRDKEEIPDFHLLPKTDSGIPGKEIDQGIIKLDVEDQNFTSVSKFTQDMVNDIPENIYNELNIEEDEIQKKVEVLSENNKENNSEINSYLTNLYGPSIADILKENAEYFENESKTVINKELKNKSSAIEANKNIEIKNTKDENKEKEIVNTNESYTNVIIPKNDPKPSTSKSETYKIGFNRTVINTKSATDYETKGILKKSKDTNADKKRVSFSRENSVKAIELETTETEKEENRIFKKPEQSKSDDKRYKNMNLIGVVQERLTIFKKKNSEEEQNEKALEDNLNKNDSVTSEPITKDNENTIDVLNKVNNKQNLEKLDNTKEIRKNRFRNSLAYKSAKLLKSNQTPIISNSSDLDSRLQTCLSEWFTFDTLLFLYGEEQISKITSETSFKHFMNKKKNLELDEKKQKQYEEICKRLNLMDLADRKFDDTVTGKKRRPLPRYEDIREQAEHMDLRVQAFYSGCYEMYEDVDTDTESTKDEEEPYIVKGPPAVLPLIDNKDVMATRRKIFQTSISRSISNICEILKESPNKLLSELKELINTFEFTAMNIVFKTNEWQFITLLLIQIISIRNKEIQKTLALEDVNLFISSLANELNLQDNYKEIILKKIQITNLLDECLRKDCVEQ